MRLMSSKLLGFIILAAFFGCSAKKESPAEIFEKQYEKMQGFDNKSLLKIVREGSDAERSLAVDLLITKCDRSCVEPLISDLKDRNWKVRTASAGVLMYLNDFRATPDLLLGIREGLPLVDYHTTDPKNKEIKGYLSVCIDALEKFKDPASIDGLVSILNDESLGDRRFIIAMALGRIGSPKAVQPLIKMLRSKGEFTIPAAASALGEIRDARAVVPLIEVLKRNSGGTSAAAYALGDIGDRRAVKPLGEALKSEDVDVRMAAAHALGKIKDKESVKYLVQASRDKSGMVASWAVLSLGKLKDPSAVDALLDIVNGDGMYLKKPAVIALGEIGDKRAIKPLKQLLDRKSGIIKRLPNDEAELLIFRENIREALRKLGATS